jgi:serine kinase of HPr protein (carbohydrate metabolism regulator)
MGQSCFVHATAVAIATERGSRAVLLRGPSGSGKSDLALRLIDAGARLVADDQTELVRVGDGIIVRPPPAIAGLIEVRGIGIVRLDPLLQAPLAMIADLVSAENIERLPRLRTERILGLDLPAIAFAAFEASAAAKLSLALRVYAEPGFPAMVTAE